MGDGVDLEVAPLARGDALDEARGAVDDALVQAAEEEPRHRLGELFGGLFGSVVAVLVLVEADVRQELARVVAELLVGAQEAVAAVLEAELREPVAGVEVPGAVGAREGLAAIAGALATGAGPAPGNRSRCPALIRC